jgi:putative tryptophan/tyrosine transport system substrate-binding protein
MKRESTTKNAKIGVFTLGTLLTALCPVANAQQVTAMARIGYLNASPTSAFEKIRTDAFLEGLREIGYALGKNIVIEWRYGDGNAARVRELAAELVRLKVDVLVTAGGASTRAAKEATVTIPIVMTQDTDPVRNGFVASLAVPGGNITGLSRLAPELSGKQVELMKETIPTLSRLAVLGSSTQAANTEIVKEIYVAAGLLGVKPQHFDVQGPKDFETAFRHASKERADAVMMLISGPVYNRNRTHVVEVAAKHRLPVIYRNREDIEAGGLISYGVHLPDLDRRAATYVDKILKGTKPAELPVEQPTKFELVINLKTAKQIGLTIPPNVLARADRAIK